MDEIILELKKDIIATLGIPDITPEQLNENEPLLGGRLGLDSIDILELVVLLKKKYNTKISDLKTAKEVLTSVSDIAKFVYKNTNV